MIALKFLLVGSRNILTGNLNLFKNLFTFLFPHPNLRISLDLTFSLDNPILFQVWHLSVVCMCMNKFSPFHKNKRKENQSSLQIAGFVDILAFPFYLTPTIRPFALCQSLIGHVFKISRYYFLAWNSVPLLTKKKPIS